MRETIDWRVSFEVTSPAVGMMFPCGDSLVAASSTSLRRPMMYTLCAPFNARALVIVRPIPDPPPVMTATRPLTLKRFAASSEDMVRLVEERSSPYFLTTSQEL